MALIQTKVRTALALGLPNISRVVLYRAGVKLGTNPVRRLRAPVPSGPFFGPVELAKPPAGVATPRMANALRLFSHLEVPLAEAPPDWLANPLTGQRVPDPERPWWQIPDFDPAVGDIKLIWELSRLDWALSLACAARAGDSQALNRLNEWLADWCACNRPYQGPNWKCGQEASIRVMHIAMAAVVLDQADVPTPGLLDWVQLHLQRIAPTVQYAMAQDNNHGTSEAAALFIGGSWLAAHRPEVGRRWAEMGRHWLEDRVARLIGEHGSFSQYSLNYHRVMLDTLCMVEVWRRRAGLPSFTERWQRRGLAAAQWLRRIINPVNGDGPNVGANDGARLLQLTNTVFRDYRPTVQLAMALFGNERAYAAPGPWNDALHWLGIPLPATVSTPVGCHVADDGGFAVLRRGRAMVMLRYPRFKFRPSQADALHVDLWLGGENLLCDAGTYSYNTDPRCLHYFGGVASHNTVQFDGRDQMPRISRFLFGDWLETSTLRPLYESEEHVRFGAGYRDRNGISHERRVILATSSLMVVDQVGGFRENAVLRWRLVPGAWQVDGSCVRNGEHVLRVRADVRLARFELTVGWASRHYLEQARIPVLEVEIDRAGTITTEYGWAS